VIKLTVIIIEESPYKILSNILLARLTPYVNEIIGDHQCEFLPNRSTTDQISTFGRYYRKNGSIMGGVSVIH
jgi:hypothetical protein